MTDKQYRFKTKKADGTPTSNEQLGKKFQATNDTIGKTLKGANDKIADTLIGTNKKIEKGVVGSYDKIKNAFVDKFLEEVPEDEKHTKHHGKK
ncbi:hypothetical protein [Schleiferilactobacillus harbinensis]|uniref:hypothetical protein n=1 Tax=Schleiferilactobacillus harbinensis TaxID=304207 RepID=UPI0039E83C24